jgi:hypothetical protein
VAAGRQFLVVQREGGLYRGHWGTGGGAGEGGPAAPAMSRGIDIRQRSGVRWGSGEGQRRARAGGGFEGPSRSAVVRRLRSLEPTGRNGAGAIARPEPLGVGGGAGNRTRHWLSAPSGPADGRPSLGVCRRHAKRVCATDKGAIRGQDGDAVHTPAGPGRPAVPCWRPSTATQRAHEAPRETRSTSGASPGKPPSIARHQRVGGRTT